ncbi:MAG TPA: transglutaminase family protein [Candidatus Binatia bacterium]|nr:transglutaminase family protein [Candidatus Binatia bacterium]
MQVALHHRTSYRYDRLVAVSPQIVRLRPAPHTRTRIVSYSLKVEPDPHFLNWQQDPFGNWQARVVFPDWIRELVVTVDLVVEPVAFNAFDFFVEESAGRWPFAYEPALLSDLQPYLRHEPPGARLRALLDSIPRTSRGTVDFLVELNQRLQHDIRYLIRLEPGVQTPEETLAKGSGSCRDSGWLLVQCLRHLGIAARFVSGYLIQLAPDVKSLDGPSGPDSDFTDLHAWAEAFVPGAGWLGLDPTSGLFAAEGHLPLAATPDPRSAAPITGTVDECEVEFSHAISVRRLAEAPRSTRPFGDDEWAAIDALGESIDARLRAGDVRLTMGGEPTFVSLDDMEGAEWNVAAVGPTKERLAATLIERLRARFAPTGIVTYGQGKWYPGESLPRWIYSLYWRGDGRPLWRLPPPATPASATIELTERFVLGLARRLDVDPACALAAYEDPFHYLLKERRLPVNVDPRDSRLRDPEERARLAAVFERGLGAPRGHVLPVQRWQGRWASERWTFRGGALFLVPGDSPIGLRLPLDQLPWLPPTEAPHVGAVDPTRPQPPLPGRRQAYVDTRAEATSNAGRVHTALAVEPRDGFVNVFLPPVETAEDWVDLLGAIEDVAVELDAPVRVEGYAPPPHAGLKRMSITPDPGVIEVNIHPARTWADIRDNTLALYEEARTARLTTEKFLIDGRTVGTGGGNQIVVGGAHPLDSPFLRRPDLLASLVRYWQNHPSLSYLFSGLFIGPTSQHPRVDEGRDSQLAELEIALATLPPRGSDVPPWLVDRIFRNLLVDVAGNTHRAEFCIDKLYAPESASGRLGLVEMRAFEMPPHARMSVVQQLLVRALIAWFWDQPYGRPLLRWGSALRDRFLLPHFLWRDFAEVLDGLAGAGLAFRPEWFRAQYEFRFPRHGSVRYRDVEIELRHALEPWPVLGEEPGAGGTTRYVDSSLERLQVTATGLTPGRHWITCNGRALPLVPTGTGDVQVAGVRYRAWQPAACLHPTIGVHTPLVFDLYDTWNGRALGGCTYHVAHPAGRNYETFPVNAREAESRRLSRFEPLGHSPGAYAATPPRIDAEHPCTLDLRRG